MGSFKTFLAPTNNRLYSNCKDFDHSTLCLLLNAPSDDKLVLVRDGKMYIDEQIGALTEFQERFFQSVILRTSPG